MSFTKFALSLALLGAVGVGPALANCTISDAQLEEAILKKPEFQDPANRMLVRDLRTLRDAAYILWAYGMEEDCERVVANVRELIAAPEMGQLGSNDEDEADQQLAATEPRTHRLGQVQGTRGAPDERPLININELGPGLRVDEIIGAEVRSADDQIVGEVRNVVIGTQDRWDYAIVASGGFFIAGTDSYVVPLRYLQVNQERSSFFLRISSEEVKAVPLMPDQEYLWLEDEDWRATNDAVFQNLMPDVAP